MLTNIFTFVSFIFVSLFCYLLFWHFCRHSSTVDKFKKNEDCSHVMYRCFSVSLSSQNFPRIFFLCSLRKPIVSQWFKNVLLGLLSLQQCLFFFHKMMKFYKTILFCKNKTYFCRTFSSHRLTSQYIIQIQ